MLVQGGHRHFVKRSDPVTEPTGSGISGTPTTPFLTIPVTVLNTPTTPPSFLPTVTSISLSSLFDTPTTPVLTNPTNSTRVTIIDGATFVTVSVISQSSTSLQTGSLSPTPSDPIIESATPSSLGPIIGGLVAALAVILLFIYLLLRHRSWQKAIRRPAEIDPPPIDPLAPTPFRLNFRENGGYGGGVSVNYGPRSATAELSTPPTAATVHSTQVTHLGTKLITNHALTPNTLNQGKRIHLATIYTSDPNPNSNRGQFQLNSLNDLIPTGATSEGRASRAPTYILNANETRFRTNFTNISTNSHNTPETAPPAYDALDPHLPH
ncbi:hypothetical protein BYT27DRAFT_7241514 [Phlegmacium glaucopus]|nr:hypothetical protein BYT27DRAFT_7241514 [Phlegmacium glaucopus]